MKTILAVSAIILGFTISAMADVRDDIHTNNLNPGKCVLGVQLKQDMVSAGYDVLMGMKDESKSNIVRYFLYDWKNDQMAVVSTVDPGAKDEKSCLEFIGNTIDFKGETFRHFVAKHLMDDRTVELHAYGKAIDEHEKQAHEPNKKHVDDDKVNLIQ